ncbi:MAG: ribosome small subunit-dependent GTPase A [Acidobacteriota bacterium]
MRLSEYGWTPFFSQRFHGHAAKGLRAGRVVLEHRGIYHLQAGEGEVRASLAGRFRHHAEKAEDRPAVGDWVAFRSRSTGGSASIHAVLPRRTKLSRKVAGSRTEEQVVAANLDTVFLVMGLDGDFNLRRMERLLTVAWESGAGPVIVLNKEDLAPHPLARRTETETIAPGVPVVLVSGLKKRGLDQLLTYLSAGETAALVGSSGVGKSTLLNCLCGSEVMPTREVRIRDQRGRHTTTHRQLFKLPNGELIIDSPGVREIQLWSRGETLHNTFEDIDALATHCRFGDCSHQGEPGCAVLSAVDEGSLSMERLHNFLSLQRELRYLERRQDEGAQRAQKKKWKVIHRAMRRHKLDRGR